MPILTGRIPLGILLPPSHCKIRSAAGEGDRVGRLSRCVPGGILALLQNLRSASADSFMLSPLAADPAGLQQHQSQGQAGVNPALAMPAAYRILQQQQPLDILYAEARQAETGGRAFGTSHWNSPASLTKGYSGFAVGVHRSGRNLCGSPPKKTETAL
jgi:hypothetical protein